MGKISGQDPAKTLEIGQSTTNSAYIVWTTVSYRECQRNHAANVGGYAVDGCLEFIPSDDEGTELAIICAACGCHRSFHRRVVDSEVVGPDDASECSSSTSSVN